MTMRKAIIAVAAILLIAMLVPVAFADTAPVTPNPVASTAVTLTKEEVNKVQPVLDKMLAAKKELMQKYVEMGKISQEDADARIQWMEQRQKDRLENGFAPGLGKGRGGRGGFGGGCGGGGCGGGGGCNYGTPAAPAVSNQL